MTTDYKLLMKKRISLETYKTRLAGAKKLILEELAKAPKNGKLRVQPYSSDNNWTEGEVFTDFSEMMSFIHNNGDRYWKISRIIHHDGCMASPILRCIYGADGIKFASVNCPYYELCDKCTALQKRICGNDFLFTNPFNVMLPYKVGDILIVNSEPFCKPYHIVFGGKIGQIFITHSLSYQCRHPEGFLFISDERKGLDIDTFSNCPNLEKLSLVDFCDEPLVSKASEMLKSNPNLWEEWLKIYDEKDYDAGGLEQWFFPY